MDPTRDLGTIADLMAEAFADELDERGQAALREMRWMALLSPLVWWWAQADPTFRDTFNGFVWEEPFPKGKGGQIVGNVSLNRTPGSRRHWIICNVVVDEAYRGRGIGRRLTEAAIAEARDLGAMGVVIQVHQDNPPALRLYTDLGCQEAAGETNLRLEAIGPVRLLEAPACQLRAWRPADGQAAYELAQLATSPVQRWIRPVKADAYRLGGWSRLSQQFVNLMRGRRVYRLVASKSDRLVAMIAVTAAFRRGDHQLELLVHPDHADQVEGALISRALNILAAIPPRPVQITVNKAHAAALNALRKFGFEEKRTLLTLRRDFT
ncbi:GNAT family N-acetyltransferase [Chloroflexota bacterium]